MVRMKEVLGHARARKQKKTPFLILIMIIRWGEVQLLPSNKKGKNRKLSFILCSDFVYL